MIKSITYSVVFPINGIELKGDFTPQPGLTAVTGPNGVGKTFMSIELPRYLLFGKKALRGAAADYKKLVVEGVFTIKGHDYKISRSAKKDTIADAVGTVLAVGPEEVDKKIVELLGYGLKVFDIANASVQQEAGQFGKLLPTARKKLIDEVVGLSSQELVEKACRTEGTALQREAEALTRQLTVPVKPTKPAGYLPSTKLQDELKSLETLYDAAQQVANQIRPAFEVTAPSDSRPTAEEEQKALEYERVQTLRNELTPLAQREISQPYTAEQLDAAAERLTLRDLADGEVTCPDCGTNFIPGVGHVHLPDGPDLTRVEINRYRRDLTEVEKIEDAKTRLAALPDVEPVPNLRQRQAAWDSYDKLEAARQHQLVRNAEAEKVLRELGEIPPRQDLEYLREVLFDSRSYERDIRHYESEKEKAKKLSAEIAELTRRSEAYKQGSVELAEARALVKAYLAPAISSAASNLIHTMTGGKYDAVAVDEDMEITVNGQHIQTLSGGNATVANIALRLALGQVLVGTVFPVFMGDEMDADADDGRREAVAAALSWLVEEGMLKQVILVTHRSVDIADHVISLGNMEE